MIKRYLSEEELKIWNNTKIKVNITLCKNQDCLRYPDDEDFDKDNEEEYENSYWNKCTICDGYFEDDGLNDLLFIEEEPNNQTAGCNLCGKDKNIVQMKGTGQYLCGNACDESEDDDVEDDKNISNEMEDSNIKAECIIWDDIEDNYKYKNISDLEGYMKVKKINSYNYGDLVSFSTYRDTGTMFIGKNGKLVGNPDYTDAGYLTIPYEITQHLKNATHKYKDIEYSYIDLRHDDDFLEKKICKNLNPEYKYVYDPCEEVIYVDYPNNSKGEFDLNSISKEDIEAFYEGSKKEQSKIKVFYELRDNDMKKFKDKYGSLYKLPTIPKTWKVYSGSGGGGSNYSNGYIHFNGPIDSMSEVIEKINIFYEGFNYKITL